MRQKRFLSWLLTLCLLLGMFSFPAYAEGNTTTISGDGTAEKTGTMTVTLVIPKKTPAATDLTYTAPSELTYSGSDKAATVEAASGITGMGNITVKYYSDTARANEATPKNVGTYYVGAMVAEGDQYAASTGVLYGDGWTFNITASTPDAPAAPTMASATKNSITLNAVSSCEYSKDGTNWQDSTEFTGLLPGTEYMFYQRVKATANTNASYASSASFTTEADTYAMTITLTIKEMKFSAEDVSVAYDGQPHGITVNVTDPNSGYTVKYGTVEGTYDLDDSPTQTEVGTQTVYYQVTANNYVTKTGSATVTISEASAVAATVTANNRTYDGTDKPLVNVDKSTLVGGEMQYALGTKDAATEEYTTSIPTATDAGTYYIWYKVVGDENHLDSDVACVTSKILADISKTVTFKVVNGSWNDGEAKDKVVKLEGFEGDTIKLSADKIPAVGTKPSDGYKEGSWDTVPKADTEIKADTTYTYTYAKKEEVKPEPIVEPAPVQKIKLTVTAKDQTIAFGAAISQASSKYTIKGLQTGDKAEVTLKADMKKFIITPVVTVKNGDKDVTDTYDITAVSANIAISQVPMVAAISKGKSITATLTKINNVDGYLIYTGYCGGTSKLVKTIKGNKSVKYTYKKIAGKLLNRKKASKVIVKAYRLVDGKKVVVATSMTAHVAGVLNKKLANASSVTVAKKNIELKSGKTANVDAKVVLTTTKKAQLYKGHAAEIRYVSSNTAVATVDAKGKITAKGKGKCTVYAVAVDGKRTTVNVKVE